jgi:hypothetical protein
LHNSEAKRCKLNRTRHARGQDSLIPALNVSDVQHRLCMPCSMRILQAIRQGLNGTKQRRNFQWLDPFGIWSCVSYFCHSHHAGYVVYTRERDFVIEKGLDTWDRTGGTPSSECQHKVREYKVRGKRSIGAYSLPPVGHSSADQRRLA